MTAPQPKTLAAGFRDFFVFQKMIAPKLIRLLYWLGSAGIVVASVLRASSALLMYGSGIEQALLTLAGGMLFLLVWRIFAELWIVIFSIHERLGEIRDALGNASAPASDTTHSPD